MKNIFDKVKIDSKTKLENFSKYVTRRTLTRFLAHNELFKLQLEVQGNIVECGVHHGGGLMTWAKLSSIYEPINYHRKIIGFDTFSGFPDVHKFDKGNIHAKVGSFDETSNYDVYKELNSVIGEYDKERFISNINKIELIKGDVKNTIPQFLKDNKFCLVSLLYLDFDIYEPTLIALKNFISRMPKGAIIAFDELNNKNWPGETVALLESIDINNFEIKRFNFEPNISYLKL